MGIGSAWNNISSKTRAIALRASNCYDGDQLQVSGDGPAHVEVSCADLRVVLEARGEPIQLKQKCMF